MFPDPVIVIVEIDVQSHPLISRDVTEVAQLAKATFIPRLGRSRNQRLSSIKEMKSMYRIDRWIEW
jgi:hypothetical protein